MTPEEVRTWAANDRWSEELHHDLAAIREPQARQVCQILESEGADQNTINAVLRDLDTDRVLDYPHTVARLFDLTLESMKENRWLR